MCALIEWHRKRRGGPKLCPLERNDSADTQCGYGADVSDRRSRYANAGLTSPSVIFRVRDAVTFVLSFGGGSKCFDADSNAYTRHFLSGSGAQAFPCSPVVCPSPAEFSREVYSEYEFLEVLGEGSFGKVHKAVKEIPHTGTADEEFQLELKALQELDHPHIVEVIEYFDDVTNFFLVMELCTGPDVFTYVLERMDSPFFCICSSFGLKQKGGVLAAVSDQRSIDMLRGLLLAQGMLWWKLGCSACLAPSADTKDEPGEPRHAGRQLTESEMAHALKDMQKRYPLLALPSHGLYAIVQESLPRAPSGLEGNCVPVQECETAVCEGDEDKAKDILERLEHEVELETTTLAAAFNLFKKPGKETLSEAEALCSASAVIASAAYSSQIRTMLEYLGFPKEDDDVEKLLKAVDTDGDRQMSLVEFHQYVARMGGSLRLFEIRRRQMEAKHGWGTEYWHIAKRLRQSCKVRGIEWAPNPKILSSCG
ncbi:Nuak2 [Symbiodinium microadriaticum]|nr:Nuak2 [Symbiodinium microadriaticum]